MVQSFVEKVSHPRVIELAKALKNHDLEWPNIQTGDWFLFNDAYHVVMRVEETKGQRIIYGQQGNAHNAEDIVQLPHFTQCREWLMNKDYDLVVQDMPDGSVKATVRRRGTDFKIEKTEPTELAAVYAAMIEVLDMMHFGWS